MKKRIVIVGGCAAGPKTAAKSRRMNPDSEINLFSASSEVSYSACGLPYYVGNTFDDINKLIIRSKDEFEKNNIHIHLNSAVTKILPDKKQVIVKGEYVDYDELVLATGSIPYTPPIKNCNLKNVFHLKYLKDGVLIKEMAKKSKSVLIVGFGYIALEMIEAFLNNGLKVYVVENHHHILSFLDSEFGDLTREYIKKRDGDLVDIITNDNIVEFFGTDKFEGAISEHGIKIHADFCLVATGVIPNTQLAYNAGIKTGYMDAICVDSKMRTNIENIWAAGDCAEKYCLITKMPIYFALGSIANKEGRVCAINLNGGEEEFLGVLGSTVSKYYDFTVAVSGITQKWLNVKSSCCNLNPISAIVTKLDKAGYMPDAKPITVKLIADKNTGRLLGAQGVGVGDVDKRINIVTSALQKHMSVDEFLHLDLTYAPPTSGAIDPLLTACYELKKQMES